MSFGQEMKDFASGFRTGTDAQEARARIDYDRERARKLKEGEKDTVTDNDNIDAMDSSGLGYDELQHPHKTAVPATTPAVIAASPVAATQAVQGVPLATYNAANSAPPPAQGVDPYADQTDGYSRGGLVRGYADGGVVPDDDQPLSPPTAPTQALNMAPAATAPTSAITPAPAQQALPVGGQPQAAPADQGSDKGIIGDALHAGLMALKSVFGLDQQSTAVGPDPQKAAGQKALMSGAGGGTPEDVKAVDQAIDPNQQLTSAERSLHRMETGYRYFMEKGEPEKAANYAAMIIQYSAGQAKKLGTAAIDDLKNGDIKGAADKLAQAGDVIPNGEHAETPKVNPDGTVSTTQVDTRTGKPIASHTLTGQQLFQMALGLKNGNGYYQTIMQAASGAKGYSPPTSDAYNNAQMSLAGFNPDGSPKAAGTAPAAQPQGQAQPQTQGQSPALAQYAAMMRGGESSGNPNAANGQSVGLYQIQPAAWKDATGHDPIVNGVDERLDPAKNAAVFQKLTQQNAAAFKQKWARDPSPLELAVMHQQGATGGMNLMQAARMMPNTPAASLVDPQHLVQNHIPANATAYQAVQIIQGHYAKFQPGAQQTARGPAAQQPADSMELREALPEDQVDKPTAPTMPSAPEVLHALPKDTNGMSPQEKVAYVKQVAQQNLNNQKQFQDQMAQYRAQVAAGKQPKAGANPLNVPLKDQADVLNNLKTARGDIESDKKNLFNTLDPDTQKVGDDVAYALLTHNQITPQQAYGLASIMLATNAKADPSKPGSVTSKQGFTAYKLPSNPDVVRIVGPSGSKYLVPVNTYNSIREARNAQIEAAREEGKNSQRKGDLVASGVKAVKAVGRGIAGVIPSADDVNRVLSRPDIAAASLAKKGIDAVNTAFSPYPQK